MTANEFQKLKFTKQDQLTYEEYDQVIANLSLDKKLLFDNTKELIKQKLIVGTRNASYSSEEYEIFQTLSRKEIYCLCYFAGVTVEKLQKDLRKGK